MADTKSFFPPSALEYFFNSTLDILCITDLDFRICRINPAVTKILGYPVEQVVGMTLIDMTYPEDRPALSKMLKTKLRKGLDIPRFSIRHKTKDGLSVRVEWSCTPYLKEEKIYCSGRVVLDVHRFTEEQEIKMRLSEIVGQSEGVRELLRAVTALLQEKSGCEAVGIRLKKGDDYPYFETRGFSGEFVEAENHLCVRDKDGTLERDAGLNPVLECMCGNVINGRFDPSMPFFTRRGSFWTNCSSELLARTDEADRGRTRNRCNKEGYESVALIRLSLGGESLGLLQFNDRRKNIFSPQTLGMWESVADCFSVALKKFLLAESLRESEAHYRGLFENMEEALAHCRMVYDEAGKPVDWVYCAVNPGFGRLTGLKVVTGKMASDCFPRFREQASELLAICGRIASEGKPEKFETYFEPLKAWFSVSAFSSRKGYFTAIFDKKMGVDRQFRRNKDEDA